MICYGVIASNDVNGIANSEDPDQTAQGQQCLIKSALFDQIGPTIYDHCGYLKQITFFNHGS